MVLKTIVAFIFIKPALNTPYSYRDIRSHQIHNNIYPTPLLFIPPCQLPTAICQLSLSNPF